jgi:molecular chaperone GrpE
MPHRTRAQQRTDEIDVSPTALLAEIERLRTELEATQGEASEYLTGLQRERAEFQNFRRRTAEERERDAGLAADGLIRKVLALADDFDRAIETRPEGLAGDAWVDGVTAIDRKLRLLLESEGVSAIGVTPGEPFDPRLHEAIVNVPGSGMPGGSIVGELQRGYRLRDRVLRPALVAVAAHESEDEATTGFDAARAAADDTDIGLDSGPPDRDLFDDEPFDGSGDAPGRIH